MTDRHCDSLSSRQRQKYNKREFHNGATIYMVCFDGQMVREAAERGNRQYHRDQKESFECIKWSGLNGKANGFVIIPQNRVKVILAAMPL